MSDQMEITIEPVVLAKEATDDEVVIRSAPKGESVQPEDTDLWTPENSIEPPENYEYLARLSEMDPVRAASIEAIARNTVGLGYGIELQEGYADRDLPDDEVRRIRTTLEACAARDRRMDSPSFTDQMFAVKTDEEEVGQGALEVSRNRETGQIDGFFHAPGKRVRRKKDRSGWVIGTSPGAQPEELTEFYNFGDKVEYAKDGTPTGRLVRGKRWKRNELIVFRRYSSSSRDYGLPRDLALALDYAAAKLAMEWNVGFFESSGTPPTVLFVQGVETRDGQRITYRVSDDLVNRIGQTLKSGSGPGDRVALVPVPPGTNVDKVALGEVSERDVGFQRFHDAHAHRVIATFRLQPIFVPFVADEGRYDAEVQRAITLEQVFDPDQDRYETRIYNTILRDLGLAHVRLAFKRLAVEGDAVRRTSADRLAEQSNITRKEHRAAHGLPPYPEGGDSPFPTGFNDELVEGSRPPGTDPRVLPGDSQQGLRPNLAGREVRQGIDYSADEQTQEKQRRRLAKSDADPFDLSELSDAQRAIVLEALSHTTFDWKRLVPGLKASGHDSIKVVFAELPGDVEADAESDPPDIRIDSGLSRKDAIEAFVSEGAHHVDNFLLTDEQREAIMEAFTQTGDVGKPGERPKWTTGPYYEQVGESFMAGFVMAYSDLADADGEDFKYPASEPIARKIKAVIG